MKAISKIAQTLVICGLLGLGWGFEKARAHSQDEWVLSQTLAYGGDRKVFLSATAIRIDNLTNGNQIVCKAPDWSVSLFKKSERLIHTGSLQAALGLFHYDPSLTEPAVVGRSGVESTLDKVKILKFGDEESGMWLTKEVVTDPHCRSLLLAYYLLKPIDGIPLRYCCKNKFRSRHEINATEWGTPFDDVRNTTVHLKTAHITKVKYTASDFDIPTGFRTATVQKLLEDKGKSAEMESLFTEMRVGQELGKNTQATHAAPSHAK